MTVVSTPLTPEDVDGRTARRDRNRVAVLDAVLELFTDGDLDPSPEAVARRSGVSLRSVYRYVANNDELIRAAIARHTEKVQPLFVIDDVGAGSFSHRLETLVDTRMRVYDAIAATARAARLRAANNPIIREQLEHGRRLLRAQVKRQFAPELDRMELKTRRAVLTAVDALSQIETIELYRYHQKLSPNQTREMLVVALRALLTRKY